MWRVQGAHGGRIAASMRRWTARRRQAELLLSPPLPPLSLSHARHQGALSIFVNSAKVVELTESVIGLACGPLGVVRRVEVGGWVGMDWAWAESQEGISLAASRQMRILSSTARAACVGMWSWSRAQSMSKLIVVVVVQDVRQLGTA